VFGKEGIRNDNNPRLNVIAIAINIIINLRKVDRNLFDNNPAMINPKEIEDRRTNASFTISKSKF
jgi:hypothetical protein